jgi:hypothetical protein
MTENKNLVAEYHEVCNNFRLLTDIRFKLLALIPIGTGTAIALTPTGHPDLKTSLIGLFGFVVTSSAALYNIRNDQLYDELVSRAAQLERLLDLKEGAFAQRPRAWRQIGPFAVNHEKIWWIYLSSLAAWLYTFLIGFNEVIPPTWSGSLLNMAEAALAIIIVFGVIEWLQRTQARNAQEQLRDAARAATASLLLIPI